MKNNRKKWVLKNGERNKFYEQIAHNFNKLFHFKCIYYLCDFNSSNNLIEYPFLK